MKHLLNAIPTLIAVAVTTMPADAQHLDILAFDAAGQVGVGEFSFDTLMETEKRVFPARLDSFYSVNNPGFTSRPGPTALPGNTNMEWDFLPMTVDSGLHAGYVSTLLYWDGLSDEPIFGPTPTDDYRFSLFGKNGTAAAGGTDELVPGHNIETTGPNGSIHEHRFYFLDDNGDGLNTTLPDAGIYVYAMQLRVEGLETSEPFFYVWATPETSILPAIQPAVAWVNDRIDTLVVDDLLLAGDYNRDGTVDAIDYAVWRNSYGAVVATLGVGADGNQNGVIDSADFTIWRDNFDAGSSATVSVSVLEPTSLSLFVFSVLGLYHSRRLSR